MLKTVIVFFSFLICNTVICQIIDKKTIILKGYLDYDNIIDTLVYLKNNDLIEGTITTQFLQLNFIYFIDNDLDTNIDLPEKGCISFISSGMGMGRNEDIEFFNFDKKNKNWINTKSMSISHNFNNGMESPNLEFSYYENDFETINNKKLKYLINKPKLKNLNKLIKDVKIDKYNKFEIIEYIFNYPINSNNVIEYNDLAFYLQNDELSLYILEIIITKFPNRVVTYLNYADSFFSLGNELKAIENYKKYIQLMKEQKKDLKKIPKYVLERIE